jgi:Domain of unknown function (DUF4129)
MPVEILNAGRAASQRPANRRGTRLALRSKTAIAAALISFYGIAPLAAQTPTDIAQAARGLPESLDLQRELPLLKPEEAGVVSWHLNADIVRILLWIAATAGACALAYYLYEIIPVGGTRRTRWDSAAASAAVGARRADAVARVAADELAAQGRFVEAMHVLLLQGLEEMRMRLDLRFADSLTSREIVSRADAPVGAKAALRDIIQWVERAYFGDHRVDRNDYEACRRSFLALDNILSAGGRE